MLKDSESSGLPPIPMHLKTAYTLKRLFTSLVRRLLKAQRLLFASRLKLSTKSLGMGHHSHLLVQAYSSRSLTSVGWSGYAATRTNRRLRRTCRHWATILPCSLAALSIVTCWVDALFASTLGSALWSPGRTELILRRYRWRKSFQTVENRTMIWPVRWHR